MVKVLFEDWNAVKSRDIYNINNAEDFLRHAIKLSFTNEKVAADNYRRLNDLGVPIASILPNHINKKAPVLPPDDMDGLYSQLLLCKGEIFGRRLAFVMEQQELSLT